jgi:tRNA-uridine 2-sulfurtransferase
VHLGGEDALLAPAAELADLHLAEGVTLPLRASVHVRYRHQGDWGTILPAAADSNGRAGHEAGGEPAGGRRARIVFDAPVRAVTAGQIAVFYDGDRVRGGGRIVRATRDVEVVEANGSARATFVG